MCIEAILYEIIYLFFSLNSRLLFKYYEKGWVYIALPQKMMGTEAYSVKHLKRSFLLK